MDCRISVLASLLPAAPPLFLTTELCDYRLDLRTLSGQWYDAVFCGLKLELFDRGMVKLTTMMGICVLALRCVLCGYVGIVVALVDLGNMLGNEAKESESCTSESGKESLDRFGCARLVLRIGTSGWRDNSRAGP